LKTAKEIVLIGGFHFEDNHDLIRGKQSEITELVEYLSTFSPDKIAVEWEKENGFELNEKYHDYLHSNTVDNDEIQQIAFRLANKLSLSTIHSVNWTGNIKQEQINLLNILIEQNHPEIYQKAISFGSSDVELNSETHILESFFALNNLQLLNELEQLYLSFTAVSQGNEHIGLSFLNNWFERELRIFQNVKELAFDNERILLLIGRDHLWMLQKLFQGAGWEVHLPFSKRANFEKTI
jgi:hypothetical protein